MEDYMEVRRILEKYKDYKVILDKNNNLILVKNNMKINLTLYGKVLKERFKQIKGD